MAIYHRILLAVDLTDDSHYIAERARVIAAALDAELEMLHVIEPIPYAAPLQPEAVVPAVVQAQLQAIDAAQARLAKLAAELGIPQTHCIVEVGNTKAQIVRLARERQADLVVLGSRERHGLSVLLNLTEDTVLHIAPCDVLAVRVRR